MRENKLYETCIVPFGFCQNKKDKWTCSGCYDEFDRHKHWWYIDATIFIDETYPKKKCYECFRIDIDRDINWWEQCFVCSQSIYTYDYMFYDNDYFICEECDLENPDYFFKPGDQHVYR